MGHLKLEAWDLVGAYPICQHCKSTNVVRDAWAEWDISSSTWALKSVFDRFDCDKCGQSTQPVWQVNETFRKKRIRRLNDALRQGNGENGSVVITQGVQALGDDALSQIAQTVAAFDDFSEDNDPHKEHDFGAVTISGKKLFWKIDYYDLRLKYLSPDPANPQHTCRVLTIMLASEY